MVKTFRQFLEGKRLTELMQLTPQAATELIGGIVQAQQKNSPANVASNLVKNVPQVAVAAAMDPNTEILTGKMKKQQDKNNPQQKAVMNTALNSLGAMPGTQGV